MEFNARDFALGVLAGWTTAFGVYQARHVLGRVRASVTERANTAQRYATNSAEGRYIGELVKFAESHHLAGKTIPLSKIVVEPRFIPPPPLAAPADDDIVREPFRVVPKIHDHPYLHAPYNIETVSIEELGKGDKALALLGVPGSGRTTALLTIALWSLDRLEFKPPRDTVQAMLEAEEAALNADARAARIKDRITREERARERLAEEQGEDYDENRAQELRTRGGVFKRYLPLYVHLANVEPGAAEYGSRVDPAEPLVRALQFAVTSVTRKVIPRKIYDLLNRGGALILIDGFDDLPPGEQARKLPWLQAFVREYRRNFIITAGPAMGYGALTNAGLTPVFLRPWHDVTINTAAEKWADNWSELRGERRRASNQRPEAALVEVAKADNRALSAFDLTLKFRATYNAETGVEALPGDWVRAYLYAVGVTEDLLPRMAQAAALQLDDGFFTVSRLTDVVLGRPAPVIVAVTTAPKPAAVEDAEADLFGGDDDDVDTLFGGAGDDDVDDLFGDDNDADQQPDTADVAARIAAIRQASLAQAASASTPAPAAAVSPVPAVATTDRKEQTQVAKAQSQLIDTMNRMGLLLRYRDDRWQFRHPLVAAYLASLTLQTATEAQLVEKAHAPTWEYALAYAAGHSTVDAAVEARLAEAPDVMQHNVLSVARWLAYASGKVAWRSTLLKQLGNLFIYPNQFPLLRERVAAALAGTRDRSTLVIFEKALKNPDPVIRRLACLSVGVLRESFAVGQITKLLRDEDENVQIAAALALGAIGTETALEEMVVALTTASESVRQAVSEALAAIPEEGYPVLYEAVNNDELMLRRAAVFGLRRVSAPWALLEIYRVFLEDRQWYVRSAAQQAFIDMQQTEIDVLKGYPAAESIPWLRDWLSAQGEEGAAADPQEALALMLEANNAELQTISATAIAQLGLAQDVDALYAALLSPQAAVRDAAHRALAELQAQIGRALPAPA